MHELPFVIDVVHVIEIPIDLLVYTPQEIEEWRDTKTAFITQIVAQGKVLSG